MDITSSISPSASSKLKITDVSRAYLKACNLYVEQMGRGISWLDTETYNSLMAAGSFVQSIKIHQGIKVALP